MKNVFPLISSRLDKRCIALSLAAVFLCVGSFSASAAELSPSQLKDMHQQNSAVMDRMHMGMMEGMNSHDPDVVFAKGMLAHHQGAVDMAKIELKYGSDPEMRQLAENVIKAQESEIKLMQGWLKTHKASDKQVNAQ